jgi:hypothetical protein
MSVQFYGLLQRHVVPVLTGPGILVSNYIYRPSVLLPNVCQFHQQTVSHIHKESYKNVLFFLAFLKYFYKVCLDLEIVLVLQRSLIIFSFFKPV